MLKIARFTLLALSSAALTLDAALPELSSIEPLEFDEASQRLVARGDARLDFGDTRMQADEITYYQEYSLADAKGNIALSQGGYRLIADRLSFDTNERIFSADLLRTGLWPVNLSGVSAGGTEEDIIIQGATVYYGDPGPLTLNVSSDEIQYVEGQTDYVEMKGATLRVGSVPVFYVPGYTYYLNNAPFYLDVGGGYDGELGAYLQTTTLFPVGSFLRLGANLDFYTDRGGLAGPTAQYVYNSESQRILGSVSTGYISDQGDDEARGVDQLNDPIDVERGFAEWRHKHQIGERITLTALASYWSDSEVTRDFREEHYRANRERTTFAEAAYAGDNYIVSAFGRFSPNDFQFVQERLPEVRVDVLPQPVFSTGAYHRASASFAQLREEYDISPLPNFNEERESTRYDFSYRVERPIHLTPWLTFTPLGGARFTGYEQQEITSDLLGDVLSDGSADNTIYELGFDLQMQAYRINETVNRTWDISGLRHIIRPVIRYRYFSDSDDRDTIAAIDREVFNLERSPLDLSDIRNIDDLSETHLMRFGFENLFQTRAEDYGSRTLAALNFYQDVLFERDIRYDGSEEDTFNASWLELIMEPAPWLKFEFASRFRTEDLTLEELRTRTTLTSGEIWELGLSTDLLNDRINQYRIDFIYRLNERNALLSDLRLDAETGEFTRFQLGLKSRIGTTWELLYAITFREDARRESDVEFGVRLRLVDPQF
ncbi:MAG: LPS assembly protein LptD [Verrucomicrobiota bacterium]